MFYTEFEVVENAFILKVYFSHFIKKWAFRSYEELTVLRRRLEEKYIDGSHDDLQEEML